METFKRTDIRKHGFGVSLLKFVERILNLAPKYFRYFILRTYIEGFRSIYENYANLARILIRELKFIYLHCTIKIVLCNST